MDKFGVARSTNKMESLSDVNQLSQCEPNNAFYCVLDLLAALLDVIFLVLQFLDLGERALRVSSMSGRCLWIGMLPH